MNEPIITTSNNELPPENSIRICGFIQNYGNGNYSVTTGILLSKEDETAIQAILEKYTNDGGSIFGTREEVFAELTADSLFE